MLKSRSNLVLTTVLIFGAVVFRMVIAGSSRITTPGFAAPGPQKVTAATSPQATLPNFADLAEAVLPAVASVKVVTIQRADVRRSTPFELFFPDSRRGNP